MGSLVAGAVLGRAFDLLFKSAFQATQRATLFSSEFSRLRSTLCQIKQTIDDVDSYNMILNRTQQEKQIFADRLLEGDELLRKCANVKRWHVFKRWYYSVKLSKLESSLVRFFQLDVAALHFRETKRISVRMSNLEGKMDELMTSILHTNQFVPRSSESFLNGFEEGGNAGSGEFTAVMDN